MKKEVKVLCGIGVICLILISLVFLFFINAPVDEEKESCFIENDECLPKGICEFQEDYEGIKYCMSSANAP